MVKLGRPRTKDYKNFGFNVIKQGARCVAVCLVCNKVLQNTAFLRLRGHRNICKPQGEAAEHQRHFMLPSNQSPGSTNAKEPTIADNTLILTKEQLKQMVSQDSEESFVDDEDNKNGIRMLDEKPQPSTSRVTGLSHYGLQDSTQNEAIQDGITEADELFQTELRMKRLRCELLEIEAYKQRLQVLQLERELKLPPSAFTIKILQSDNQPTSHVNISVEQNNEKHSPLQNVCDDNAQTIEQTSFIKDEVDD